MSHPLRVKPDPIPQLYSTKFKFIDNKINSILNNIQFYNKIELLLPGSNICKEDITNELINININQYKIKVKNFKNFKNLIKGSEYLQSTSGEVLITIKNQQLLIVIPTYLKQNFNINFKPLNFNYCQLELNLIDLLKSESLLNNLECFFNSMNLEEMEFLLSFLYSNASFDSIKESLEILEEIKFNWNVSDIENIHIPANLPKDANDGCIEDLAEFYDHWGNISCNIDRLYDENPLDPYLSEFDLPDNCQPFKLKKYVLTGSIPSTYLVEVLKIIEPKPLNSPYSVINVWNSPNTIFTFNNTKYLDPTTMSLVLNGEKDGDSWLLRLISNISNH